MSFQTFYLGLPVAERTAFAQRANTSRAVLQQVAYGMKKVELGFADVIVAVAGGGVTLDDLPLTENATKQRTIRSSARAPTEA